jgi:mRNA interferase YafQ
LRELIGSTAFRKDARRCQKRGKDMAKLKTVLDILANDLPLDPRHRDHPLKGEWQGWRDLHIESDWLLLYKVTETEVLLARTGTHSDLFGE